MEFVSYDGGAELGHRHSVDKEHERRVVLFTCFLCLVVVAEGYDIGVLNGAIVRVKDEFKCSTLEISLIVAMTPLNIMPGSLVGGALADAFGRWPSLLACALTLTCGPLSMALAQSVAVLVLARAAVGFGIGMGYVVVSMYIAEIAPAHMRGQLTTLEEVFLNVGMLGGYLINWVLLGTEDDWRWMLALGSVLPLGVLLAMQLPQMPESPRYLFKRGFPEEAEKVLTTFVGREEAAVALQAMRKQQEQKDTQDFVTWRRVLWPFDDRRARRMVLAGVIVACAQTACGYPAVAFFSSTVLKKSMPERAAFIATTVMGLVKLLVVFGALMLLERLGRRTMLLASTVTCALAASWLAVVTAAGGGWLAQAFGFSFFMAGVSMGLGPVCFVYVAEVFTTEWRGKGMGLAMCLSRIISFLWVFSFPLMIEGLGISNSFWLMACVNVLLVWLIWEYVYETQGQSLDVMISSQESQDS